MDEIQRKLALIDKQLAQSPANVHKQIIGTSPLLFVAIGLIAGILLQSALTISIGFWFVLLILCVTAAVVSFFASRRPYLIKEKDLPLITAYLALLCFLCLGAIRLIAFHQLKFNDIANLIGNERSLATIRGVIITEPYIQKNEDWKFARFKPVDPASGFYMKTEEIKTVTGWAKVVGTIRVRVDEPVLDLKTGDYIQAYCWLERFKKATNPGQFDMAKYLARKNIFVAASVKSRDGIELLRQGPTAGFVKIKTKLRQATAQALLGSLQAESPSEGLLEALLLGYRGNIDSVTYRVFRRTGLLHFISLSGMHLGILVGIIWWLCKTAGLMKPARAIVCIISIVIFLLIVPPRAPTVRAAIIGFVFCASFLFRRRPNSINTLSLAAIILLLIRPTNLFEAGWQLSFATVLGILLFHERVHFFIYETITGLPWYRTTQTTKPFFRIIARPGPYLLRLLSTGITAWLGGAGILLYHFYTINPLASLWTVVVFPFVALILTMGYLKIILSFMLPTAAWLLGGIVTGLSDTLIWIVKLLANLNVSQILIGRVSPAPIILYYCLILFAGLIYLRRPLIKKAICALLALAIIVSLGFTKWQKTHRDELVIHCLDVGHGQAILAQLPGKTNVLFDAGSLHKSDIGRRIVAPFLDYKGIQKIDAIVISHNDVDHINGIPEIVEHCAVDRVYANQAFLSEMDKWGTAQFLKEQLNENGRQITPVGKELNVGGGAKIKILWPDEKICRDKTLGDNDKSVVSLIEFGDSARHPFLRKILLCSDIERFAQQKFLELFPDLKVDVIAVPHHSSAQSMEPDFVRRLEPGISICSCGQTQYERLQAINQTKNSSPLGASSFYTARDGAITVCINKDGTINFKSYIH